VGRCRPATVLDEELDPTGRARWSESWRTTRYSPRAASRATIALAIPSSPPNAAKYGSQRRLWQSQSELGRSSAIAWSGVGGNEGTSGSSSTTQVMAPGSSRSVEQLGGRQSSIASRRRALHPVVPFPEGRLLRGNSPPQPTAETNRERVRITESCLSRRAACGHDDGRGTEGARI